MEITKKGCLKYFLITLGVLIFIGILLPDESETKKKDDNGSPANVENEEKNKSPWQYSQTSNEMDGTKYYFASNTSLNELKFEFPYGSSDFTLTLRYQSNGRTDIMLQGSSCQFLGSLGTEYVRLKFDEKEPFNVYYSEPEDVSSGLIFLQSTKKIISNIKTAKELKIEAPFFQEGRQIIRFNVENLEWEH